jgi:glutamate:GABA antiporter
MASITHSKHRLGLFSLVMIAVVSVDSLRNLPIGAQYGFSLVSFYLLAGVAFFLPLAWVTSRLVAQYPNTGGSYVWIEKAFGGTCGFVAIWLQWVYNIIWYPTIFAFINATIAALLFPSLVASKWFILLTSLGFFWSLSVFHCFGVRASRWISAFGAIIGTLLPMTIIAGLAIYHLASGSASATPFSWQALLPDTHSLNNLAFFSNILFGLMGLEVIAMHAGHVDHPHRTYPRALGLSAVLILLTLLCSSLALCVILPAQDIALISGLMDVFNAFFTTWHVPGAVQAIGVCIVIGGLAIASSWMVGLARGLHVAFCSIQAPAWLQRNNRHHMPSGVLMLQAVVYTVLMSVYLLFPNINSSYWVLSALTAQFALLYYILFFCAAMKLLHQQKMSRVGRVLGMVFPLMACLICVSGIVVGFLPPDQIPFGNTLQYESLMAGCFLVVGLFPALILRRWRKGKKQSSAR